MIDYLSLKVCVIGLGYVGLPLAVAFGKKINTLGFDSNKSRISELKQKIDVTNEISIKELDEAKFLNFTSEKQKLRKCNVYIVAVPTPVDKHNNPNFENLIEASNFVGTLLNSGDAVIYESTVFPGATEEICVPILERISGMQINNGFYCGYSPERINPGDKQRTISKIVKITSGSNPYAAKFVDDLYKEVIEAGTYPVSSMKIAEAAKIIENTQRDINIALMNELSEIFYRLDIDTTEVLDAAKTKWNFINFNPGLVGGHCIGVDPYYLAHKAKSLNFVPEMILSGRRINDGMASRVTSRLIKILIRKKIPVRGANILIMGLTFKENCPDTRNSKVFDLISEIKDYECNISVFDPWIKFKRNDINFYGKAKDLPKGKFDATIIAVAHDDFKTLGIDFINKVCAKRRVIFDLKAIFNKNDTDQRL